MRLAAAVVGENQIFIELRVANKAALYEWFSTSAILAKATSVETALILQSSNRAMSCGRRWHEANTARAPTGSPVGGGSPRTAAAGAEHD
ncbi:hypothetical protein [Rhodococcus jostii]|uniref:Uncharacterized protein n=1 Tax=Rhodococcus jostii TaxID=132919 RepID=A0ABU4CJB3_RHOJO|nr:hypothetical protein [Rhodococcus jostii]MDV6283644.1 hypothetical protein [Rhodococcus jostii]